jgi:hypothetical protein
MVMGTRTHKQLKLISVAICAFGFFALVPSRSAPQAVHTREYALANGTKVVLPVEWLLRDVSRMPPPQLLATYAPPIAFTDLLMFENVGDFSQFQIAATNNPYLGKDSSWLDKEMHQEPSTGAGMAAYLFYFFFPPPRGCLTAALADFQMAVKSAPTDSTQPTPGPEINIQHECAFAPTLSDFYAFHVATAVKLGRTNNVDHLEGVLQNFYFAPMEQVEFNDQTFYVFEAQGQTQLTADTASHFDLPETLQGAQADYFWAVGAPTPFPFIRDASRRNIPVIQVAYGGIGLGPNKRPEFIRVLRTIRIAMSPSR